MDLLGLIWLWRKAGKIKNVIGSSFINTHVFIAMGGGGIGANPVLSSIGGILLALALLIGIGKIVIEEIRESKDRNNTKKK